MKKKRRQSRPKKAEDSEGGQPDADTKLLEGGRRWFYFALMKHIVTLLVAGMLWMTQDTKAQDAALEERLNKVNGHVADLLEAQKVQQERISELAKAVEALREQMAKTPVNSASREEIRKVAEQIQEVDQKRVADNERIMREIEKLGRAGLAPPSDKGAGKGRRKTANQAEGQSGNEKVFEHIIESGDTPSTIAMAYREKGFKVTTEQIIKANPGLKATSLQVGQKIYIPVPKE